MTNLMQQTVVVTDYDYGGVDAERGIIEAAGLRLVVAECKTEDEKELGYFPNDSPPQLPPMDGSLAQEGY